MRRTLMGVVSVLLIITLVFFAVGCDLAGNAPEDNEEFMLANYREVTLGDLDPVGEDLYVPPENFPDDLSLEMESLALSLEAIGTAIDNATNVGYTPRTMDALVSLRLDDEHFTVTGTIEESPEVHIDYDLDYLDFILRGTTNSLSNVIGVLVGEGEVGPIIDLESDGRIGLSTYMEGTSDVETNMQMLVSAYANVTIDTDIAAGETEATGTVSGAFNLSFGINSIFEYDEETGTYTEYRVPVVVQIDMLPFTDAAIEDLTSFGEIASGEDWTNFTTLIWGAGHEGDCLVITRIIGDANGNEVDTDTWNGLDAIEILFPPDV